MQLQCFIQNICSACSPLTLGLGWMKISHSFGPSQTHVISVKNTVSYWWLNARMLTRWRYCSLALSHRVGFWLHKIGNLWHYLPVSIIHYTCQVVRSGFRRSFSWLSIVLRMRRRNDVPPTWCSVIGKVKDTTQGVKVYLPLDFNPWLGLCLAGQVNVESGICDRNIPSRRRCNSSGDSKNLSCDCIHL